MATVVLASAAGTAFEWYDFFVFGSLQAIIAKTFFAGLDPTSGQIASLALFGVGFAFRPLGALIFGGVGDRLGRKAAFLICVSMMGGATFAIGLLPSYQQAGVFAPIALITLRILQGTALGGQYGGAAIYVAEYAPADRRGFMTGWVQTSAAFGLFSALAVIFVTRKLVGENVFAATDWFAGWRIPFFVSIGLVAISLWMRSRLEESPAFARMKAAGTASRAPYREAFGHWPNLKLVIIAFVALMSAQGAYWYTVFFYSQVFLQSFLKVPGDTVNELILICAVVSAPLYVAFAWLSDKVGRKPVMWAGMTIGVLTLFPGFNLLSHAANPALVDAVMAKPVIVAAAPGDCSLQFDITGRSKAKSSCDIAKAALAGAGVSYSNAALPAGSTAEVRVGGASVVSVDGQAMAPADLAAQTARVDKAIVAALGAAGYPPKLDPARMNFQLMLMVLLVFTVCATALYGPMAASLAELFPARVRYTALSLPYHLGTGWIGGFQPVVSFTIVVVTGNIFAGLWYPVIFTALSVVACWVLLPETKGRSLET
jgi:MFS family permease